MTTINCKYMEYKPKHFSEHEFQKVSCSIADLDPSSLRRLDAARDVAGIPFIITSAYRSKEHELAQGRSGNSAHTRGRAFDIACSTDRERAIIVRAAVKVGFTRIGIAHSFIHLDDDVHCLPSPRLWLY